MNHHRSAVALAALAALALAACGSDATVGSATIAPPAVSTATADTTADTTAATTAATTADTTAAAGVPASGVTLTISDRAFSAVTAKAGEPITIDNQDGFSHTVTDRDGAFDVKVAGGAAGTLTIDAPGTYSIFCKIHPDMAGTITVE